MEEEEGEAGDVREDRKVGTIDLCTYYRVKELTCPILYGADSLLVDVEQIYDDVKAPLCQVEQ